MWSVRLYFSFTKAQTSPWPPSSLFMVPFCVMSFSSPFLSFQLEISILLWQVWSPRAWMHCSPLPRWEETWACVAVVTEQVYFAFVNFKRNLHLSLKPVRVKCIGSLLCPQCHTDRWELLGCWSPCVREGGLKNPAKIPLQSFKSFLPSH